MRHLDVKLLWLQECVQKGLFERSQGERRHQRRRCVDKVPRGEEFEDSVAAARC